MPRRPGSIDVDQIDFSEAVSQNVVFSGSVKFANLGPKGNPLVIDVDGQVSGSDFLTIDSTNNQIGVNTDTPKYILDIKTNNGGIRLGNTTNSGEKSSNIHFTELADANGLNAYGFSLKYNASDNAFNVMRHNNNTSGVSVMNFSRAFGNVQIGDVDPTRFGGTGVPKLWVNADVNDRGIIRCSQHSADSDPPQFEISKARGTMESPAAVQSLDYIAQLRAMGHDGTDFQISSDLLWIASDSFTSTSRPSTLTIRTVASGTTSPAERMRITHDGKVGIGTTTPDAKLDVNGAITASGSIKSTSLGAQTNVVMVGADNALTSSTQMKIDSLGNIAVANDMFVSGNLKTENNISFVDENGTFPTNTAGFFWDLNNDEARIYAKQPASDQIDFVFKLSDNNNSTDRYLFWIDDYRGGSYDRYPLLMHGGEVLFHMTETSEGVPNGSTSKVRIDSSGRIAMQATSDPSTATNYAHIYSKDVASSAEVFVRDEAGNVTQISPHNEEGEWQYFSRNTKTGKVVRVNMEKMIRKLEEITGESFMEEWYEDIED